MAAESGVAQVAATPLLRRESLRYAAVIRVTHWLTVLCFLALLLSGGELVISHPRFYWGEAGNVNTRPLFTLPIASSRKMVPTAYKYVMPDQNGWSRSLHFQAAWAVVLTGLIYVLWGMWTGHFRKNLVPAFHRIGRNSSQVLARYLRRAPADEAEAYTYNVVQRTTYLGVIFVLFPMVIWTGLAMSPAFVSAVPAAATLLGGRQSARTLHFFVSGLLLLFLVVHITMIALAGFWSRTRAMITGRAVAAANRPKGERA